MVNLNLDDNEGIILQSEDVTWVTRNDLDLENFVLTNKKLYCTYEKSNGVFKKPTKELCVLSLSDIKTYNGQAFIQQIKYEGSWCLQIQFRQGTECFSFSASPKKIIPQWISALNFALGITMYSDTPTTSKKSNLLSDVFTGVFTEVTDAFSEGADNFKRVIEAAAETFGNTGNHSEHSIRVDTTPTQPVHDQPVYTQKSAVMQDHKHSFCMNCGTQLPAKAKFCSACGCRTGEVDAKSAKAQNPIGQDSGIANTPLEAHRISQVETNISRKLEEPQRQNEYVGKVFKCPRCGEVVNQSDVVCGSCGYHLSGKQAMFTAIDFQQQLLNIEMRRQDKKFSLKDRPEVLDATDKQMIALIKSYPIPNSIDDIVEFFHLTIGNIDVNKSKKSIFNTDDWDGGNRERSISNAWIGKLQQIYKKAELYFPNEPEFTHIKETYMRMMKDLKFKA